MLQHNAAAADRDQPPTQQGLPSAQADRLGARPAEDRQINLKAGSRELSFKGLPYLTSYALPNFFFHYTTAYAILRHNGLDLSKTDFIGAF